ncbi:MAG: glycosyltransferase [Nitrospirota bacterium]|jgi:glycosyltransferase involved in cell wall biosynthesis
MTIPTVSVIVPVRNGERVLPLCLNAMRSQTYPAECFEVIVVDDESTDTTAQMVEKMAEVWRADGHGPRLRVIRKSWGGAGAARNRGVQEACGEVILFTDADCEPTSIWIEEMMKPLADTTIHAVAGGYLTRQKSRVARLAQAEFEDRYRYVARHKFVDIAFTHSAAVRRDAFIQSKGFDERMPNNADDLELSYRLVAGGHPIVFAPKGLVYHQHPATWGEYIRKKASRGYWRTLVFKRYPEKLAKDTYTPQTLKLQILLVGLVLLFGFGGLLGIRELLGVSISLFLTLIMTTLPFTYRLQGALDLKLLAPLFLVVQAGAIGFGTLFGLVGTIEDYEIGGRKAKAGEA